MCQQLSTTSKQCSDFICNKRGLTEASISQHYMEYITELNIRKNTQLHKDLTLATYKRSTSEKGFTRAKAAFGLGIATSTLKYNNYVERNQGIYI